MNYVNKHSKVLICIILLISVLFILIFSQNKSKETTAKTTFGLEQFKTNMKAKNYKFELKDVQKDILPATREKMIIGKESIYIYLYSSNKEVEEDAKRIVNDGSAYENGNKSVQISWASQPYFYKKGNIIVLYVGVNEKIISDLKDILGEQFAGYKL